MWGGFLALSFLALLAAGSWTPYGALIAEAQERERPTPTPERGTDDGNDNVTTVDPGNVPGLAPTPTNTPIIVGPASDIPGLAPTWDLRAARIDVYQSVTARFGSSDTAVPLVARKESMVRVYVELTGTDAPKNAMVNVEAFRKGEYVGNCDSWLFATTQPVNPGSLANPFLGLLVRDDLSRTFNFTFYNNCSVLDEGDVTFKATVSGAECANCGSNNTVETTVHFTQVRPLKIKPYLVLYDGPGPNNGMTPNWTTEGLGYLLSQYPINDYELKPLGTLKTDIDLDVYVGHDPGTPDDPNSTVDDAARDAWWADFYNFLLFFHDNYGSASADVNTALFHQSIVGCAGIAAWSHSAIGIGCGGTYAHEWGHSFGLPHASDFHGECAGGGCDPNWVYPHGGIANHGWDMLQPAKLVLPDGELDNTDPWHSHDTLSYGGCEKGAPGYGDGKPWYCANWLSVKNYAHIAQRLRCADPQWSNGSPAWPNCWNNTAPFNGLASEQDDSLLALSWLDTSVLDPLLWELSSLTGLPLGGSPALAQTEGGRAYLLISGEIGEDGSATFKPFWGLVLPGGSYDQVGEGSLRLELLGSDGSILFIRDFEPFPIYAHTHMHRALFDEYLPADPNTSLIRLWRDEELLAERQVSAGSPRVMLLTPNGGEQLAERGEQMVEWEAADGDGDRLVYWLQYSADGGLSWETVRKNIADTRYPLDLSQLPGSDSALLRVIATDGANSAHDDSDGTFMVGGKAPFVEITAPQDGSNVPLGAPLVLEAVASDHEDGMLHGEALQWMSSLDGALGAGERVLVPRLSEGLHVLTLTATDGDGQQGQAMTTLIVAPPAP